ncbi:alpha/beta hydrolase [Alsobacter soli]|uniref:Alpha/beta hydrolase n=1 Tax=Alsobacter soli TaxID=2109933 RepID=A0A2T1HQX1_9HYPH|nr:alpha/beta hydrolase [Alsobacter soli]PSC04051.1 alpha/beta hydrolase [Alsobacter soli]
MRLTVDGHPVFAATGGKPFDPALPAVVFIHGAGMDHTVWALQARWFAHHGRAVLAVDLPGHGASEGPPLRSIESMADWTVRLLDAAGVRKAALVGHSMGGLVALEAATRHPGRVRAIGLVGTAAAAPVSADLLAAAEANDHRAVDMVAVWGFGPRAGLGGSPVPGLWMLGDGVRLLERSAPGVLHADLAACDAYKGGLDAAGRARCPAALVLGEKDQMTPAKAGRALGAAIMGAVTQVVPKAGHMLMVEAPEDVLDGLRAVV